mgnify:CR=1 FL=1
MEIFEKKRTRFLNRFKVLLPVSLLVFLCLSFLFSINYTSEETLQKQQQMLIQVQMVLALRLLDTEMLQVAEVP